MTRRIPLGSEECCDGTATPFIIVVIGIISVLSACTCIGVLVLQEEVILNYASKGQITFFRVLLASFAIISALLVPVTMLKWDRLLFGLILMFGLADVAFIGVLIYILLAHSSLLNSYVTATTYCLNLALCLTYLWFLYLLAVYYTDVKTRRQGYTEVKEDLHVFTGPIQRQRVSLKPTIVSEILNQYE